MRDDYCVVLDFLPKGHAAWKRPEPIAQCIGEKYFALLEIVPREGIVLKNCRNKKVAVAEAINGRVNPANEFNHPNDATT